MTPGRGAGRTCGSSVHVTDLPVNADFEDGFADDAGRRWRANVERCVETGVAGLSIEDKAARPAPSIPVEVAVDRLRAARAAIDRLGRGRDAGRPLRGLSDADASTWTR